MMNDNNFQQTGVDFHFLQNALQNFTHDGPVVSPSSLDWDDSQYDDDSLFMSTSSYDSFSSSATTINTPGINTPENTRVWDSTLYGDCANPGIGYSGRAGEGQERWVHQMEPLELPSHLETHFAHSPSTSNLTESTVRNMCNQGFHSTPCGPNYTQRLGPSKAIHEYPLILNASSGFDRHIDITVSRSNKRKLPCTIATSPDEQRPIKKTAHNMIEKRYRNKLNDSIAELRDSVPSLRLGGPGMEKEGDPMPKLYKATVISKAVEHILILEKEISRLTDEVEDLRSRYEDRGFGNGSGNREKENEKEKLIPPLCKL